MNNEISRNTVEDKANIPVNILSLCCIPILGIIMFFVWKDERPTAAKSALIFGLIGIGLSIILSIIGFVLGLLGAAVDPYSY